MGKYPALMTIKKSLLGLFLAALIVLLSAAPVVKAAPVAPDLTISVSPEFIRPAEGGVVYVGGRYPLDVTVTLEGEPLNVFWAGDGYRAVFAYPFDALPGEREVVVTAVDPISGAVFEMTKAITVIYYEFPEESVSIPYNLVDLLDTGINENEQARLDAIYGEHTNRSVQSWPFVLPVPNGDVTSQFGGDRTYNGGMWYQYHTGTDFRRLVGEPVYATADGWVVAVEGFEVRGGVVILDHGNGIFSQYAHLSEFFVNPGEYVHAGQILGSAGATGRTSGPHLHFEIVINGQPVDAIRWYALNPEFVPPREVDAVPGRSSSPGEGSEEAPTEEPPADAVDGG